MSSNGWISVYDSEKPESGEEVLTLAYAGDFPAPADMFAHPEDRVYCVCTYFYPGDQDLNEVVTVTRKGEFARSVDVIFDEEGFYLLDTVGPHNASVWRRIKDIKEGVTRGIICWKAMDYPTMD